MTFFLFFQVSFTPFHVEQKREWEIHCTLRRGWQGGPSVESSHVRATPTVLLTFSEGSFRALRSSSSSSRIFNGLLGPFFPFESLLLSEFCQEKRKWWLFSVVPSCPTPGRKKKRRNGSWKKQVLQVPEGTTDRSNVDCAFSGGQMASRETTCSLGKHFLWLDTSSLSCWRAQGPTELPLFWCDQTKPWRKPQILCWLWRSCRGTKTGLRHNSTHHHTKSVELGAYDWMPFPKPVNNPFWWH